MKISTCLWSEPVLAPKLRLPLPLSAIGQKRTLVANENDAIERPLRDGHALIPCSFRRSPENEMAGLAKQLMRVPGRPP